MGSSKDFDIVNGILKKYKGPGGDVAVPEGITSIGTWAFSGCSSLESITLPEGVTSIGNCAFSGCRSLKSITLPEGVTNIGSISLSECSSLTDVYYEGTEEDWNRIEIGFGGNDCLRKAKKHFGKPQE